MRLPWDVGLGEADGFDFYFVVGMRGKGGGDFELDHAAGVTGRIFKIDVIGVELVVVLEGECGAVFVGELAAGGVAVFLVLVGFGQGGPVDAAAVDARF